MTEDGRIAKDVGLSAEDAGEEGALGWRATSARFAANGTGRSAMLALFTSLQLGVLRRVSLMPVFVRIEPAAQAVNVVAEPKRGDLAALPFQAPLRLPLLFALLLVRSTAVTPHPFPSLSPQWRVIGARFAVNGTGRSAMPLLLTPILLSLTLQQSCILRWMAVSAIHIDKPAPQSVNVVAERSDLESVVLPPK